MVLLVPDDMPEGATTIAGDVKEMQAMYRDWDPRSVFYGLFLRALQIELPRIPKLLQFCESVYKWKLCMRLGMDEWSHPSGCFTLLGDAVHATLPYLASG